MAGQTRAATSKLQHSSATLTGSLFNRHTRDTILKHILELHAYMTRLRDEVLVLRAERTDAASKYLDSLNFFRDSIAQLSEQGGMEQRLKEQMRDDISCLQSQSDVVTQIDSNISACDKEIQAAESVFLNSLRDLIPWIENDINLEVLGTGLQENGSHGDMRETMSPTAQQYFDAVSAVVLTQQEISDLLYDRNEAIWQKAAHEDRSQDSPETNHVSSSQHGEDTFSDLQNRLRIVVAEAKRARKECELENIDVTLFPWDHTFESESEWISATRPEVVSELETGVVRVIELQADVKKQHDVCNWLAAISDVGSRHTGVAKTWPTAKNVIRRRRTG